MRIGVIDSEAEFKGAFFSDKLITNLQQESPLAETYSCCGYTHSELVVASILKQDPCAEIVLYPLKNHGNKFLLDDVVQGIEKLMLFDVDIINLSLGIEGGKTERLKQVIHSAIEKEKYVVAAFENSAEEKALPAAYDEVLGVCANAMKVGEKYFEYDPQKNNVYFKHNWTDFYQLGIPYSFEGNSFLSATVSGIISSFFNRGNEVCIEKMFKLCTNDFLSIDWIQQDNVLLDFSDVPRYKRNFGINIVLYISMSDYHYQNVLNVMEKIKDKERKNLVFYLHERNPKYEIIINYLVQEIGKDYKKIVLTRPFYRCYDLYGYKKRGISIYQGGW